MNTDDKVMLHARYPDVTLREYIEGMLTERDRATEVAEREREKAAAEQRQAATVAGEEREKSAAELRRAMEERIATGDQALHDHIEQQVAQIRAALLAADKFTDEVQRSHEEAVDKAFAASTALAAKHNDLIRAGERDKDKFATKEDLTYVREILGKTEERDLVPREVYDNALGEWSTWRESVEKRLVQSAGQREGVGLSARAITGLVSFAFIAISLILVVGDVLTP